MNISWATDMVEQAESTRHDAATAGRGLSGIAAQLRQTTDTKRGGLRAGSKMGMIERILYRHGKPMHVTEIVLALGVPPDNPDIKKKTKSLSGCLNQYHATQQVFIRVAPNTFGLIEWNNA